MHAERQVAELDHKGACVGGGVDMDLISASSGALPAVAVGSSGVVSDSAPGVASRPRSSPVAVV